MNNIRGISLDKKFEVSSDEASINRLSAAMLFPNGTDEQTEYLRQLARPRPGSSEKSAASSISSILGKHIARRANSGIVAGSCLMYFRFLQQSEIETKAGNSLEASQRAVLHLCKKHNLGRPRESDENPSGAYRVVTIPSARAAWKDYQQVSHLWAAYIHLALDGNPTCIGPKDHVLENVDISVMLFLARQYERFVGDFFNGEKVGKSVRKIFSPFRVRYFDWNEDDVLKVDIPEVEHISSWATGASKDYVPDL